MFGGLRTIETDMLNLLATSAGIEPVDDAVRRGIIHCIRKILDPEFLDELNGTKED